MKKLIKIIFILYFLGKNILYRKIVESICFLEIESGVIVLKYI